MWWRGGECRSPPRDRRRANAAPWDTRSLVSSSYAAADHTPGVPRAPLLGQDVRIHRADTEPCTLRACRVCLMSEPVG
jgi:hypothetical protein